MKTPLLVGLIFLISLSSSLALPPALFVVSVDKVVHGKIQITIIRQGQNHQKPNESYTCRLSGYVSKGVIAASEIRNFTERWQNQNGQGWSRSGKPLAGYLYFFRENGVNKVNIQLLCGRDPDSHDQRPRPQDLNGTHEVSGNGADEVYKIYKRRGRTEHWLDSINECTAVAGKMS